MIGVLISVEEESNETVSLIGLSEVELSDSEVLASMYGALECSGVDVVRLAPGIDMWLDDEGMYTKRVNPLATLLARSFGYTSQSYFGHALLLSSTADGDSIGLSTKQIELVKRVCHAIVQVSS